MKIKIGLSQSSIQNAINQLKEYELSLNDKNALFVKRLAQLGIPVIENNINISNGISDKYHDTKIDVRSFGNYSQAVLSVSGKDILFIEFGAGKYYNPTNPDHADKFGYGVGTYPGQTHAFDDGWWYVDSTGAPQYTHGTQATAPMLSATHEIIENIRKIAREVYGTK